MTWGKSPGSSNLTERPIPTGLSDERVRDYKEIIVPLSNGEVSTQAARCMDCGIPFCHAMGCPVYNLIPEWNDLVYRGKWQEAYERLEMTNNLPEITGRICPAPCEASCTLSINASPVTIKQIELAIIENAFARGGSRRGRRSWRAGRRWRSSAPGRRVFALRSSCAAWAMR